MQGALLQSQAAPGKVSKADQAAVDGDPAVQAGLELGDDCPLSRRRQVIQAWEAPGQSPAAQRLLAASASAARRRWMPPSGT